MSNPVDVLMAGRDYAFTLAGVRYLITMKSASGLRPQVLYMADIFITRDGVFVKRGGPLPSWLTSEKPEEAQP